MASLAWTATATPSHDGRRDRGLALVGDPRAGTHQVLRRRPGVPVLSVGTPHHLPSASLFRGDRVPPRDGLAVRVPVAWGGLRGVGAHRLAAAVRKGVLDAVALVRVLRRAAGRLGAYPPRRATQVQAWTAGAVWALEHEWDARGPRAVILWSVTTSAGGCCGIARVSRHRDSVSRRTRPSRGPL